MSLLLDALKKSAEDKQKSLQDKTVSDDSTAVQTDVQSVEESANNDSETSVQEVPFQSGSSINNNIEQDSEALTLDPIEPALSLDEAKSESELDEHESPPDKTEKKRMPGNNNVSDEALLLLINKTNRDVKNSKRITVIGVLLASIAILVCGGIYYYFDVQDEMASLERKHQISMQAMRAKTSDEKIPEKSEVIQSFTNKTATEEKVKLAKRHIASEGLVSKKSTPKKTETKSVVKEQANTASKEKSAVSLQRTNKSDPIAEKLDDAWLAYQSGQYDESEKLYSEALRLEKNNRDALLGMGAIAIQKKDFTIARKYYLTLLKQDPRDPIATAAIASLHSDKSAISADEKYLLSMLEKNPEAAHLNFALGNVYAQKGEWKPAQEYYFSAWQQDNENADYVFNLAISLDQLGKRQQALKFYTESLQKSMNKQVSFSRDAVQQRIKILNGL
jgi:tetratricopeptide (TPR) repeat protein